MSKEAIKYLKENKDKYSREELINALVKNNYTDKDIKESLREVYEERGEMKGEKSDFDFLNFKDKKAYFSKKDKVIDFLFGFFAPMIIIFIFSSLFRLLGFFSSLILIILLSIFVFIKRRWIFYGFITWFLITIILLVIAVYYFLNNFNIY